MPADSSSFLISGSSRGLGRMLAEHYLSHGHKVYGCSRGECDLSHENYRHFVLDISDEASTKAMFREVSKLGGRVDVLINNAGLALSKPFLLTTGENAKGIFDVNVIGSFNFMREATRLMMRQRYGRIIGFSSINVPLGSVGSSVYSASKAATVELAHALARETVGFDITINTLGLSLVGGTGMAEGLSKKASDDKTGALLKPDPLTIEDIVHAIDFLRMPAARNITNQIIYFGGVR